MSLINNIPKHLLDHVPSSINLVDLDAPIPNGIRLDRTIGICSGAAPWAALKQLVTHRIKHVIQFPSADFEHELQLTVQLIEDQDSFFKSPSELLLSKDDDPPVKNAEYTFNNISEKQQILAKAGKFITELPAGKRVVDSALQILDELFTNAALHGPGKVDGLANRPSAAQSTPNEIFISATQQWLILGCRDHYGSLDVDKLLARIDTCYKEGVDKSVQMDKKGAGIGFWLIFEQSPRFYIGLKQGRCTQICVRMPMNNLLKSELLKNIHII